METGKLTKFQGVLKFRSVTAQIKVWRRITAVLSIDLSKFPLQSYFCWILVLHCVFLLFRWAAFGDERVHLCTQGMLAHPQNP